MIDNFYSLIEPDVLNGFFVCAGFALFCIGISILISNFKN